MNSVEQLSASNDRYLVDSDDLVAGLGHLTTSFNIGLKAALRNKLALVAGPSCSDRQPVIHRLRSAIGKVLLPTRRELYDHQGTLREQYKRFLHLEKHCPSRKSIEALMRTGNLTTVALPEPLLNQDGEDMQYAELDRIIRSHPGSNVAFVLPAGRFSRCDGNFESTRPILRDLYRYARALDPVRDIFPHSFPIRIAVNIRRGDIVRNSNYHDRLLPDSYYCNIINTLSSALSPMPIQVAIISDADSAGRYVDEGGNYVDWRSHPLLSQSIPVAVHLNEELWLEALHAMVTADILITSKSGFSHLAAILSDGLKLVCDMWLDYHATPNIVAVQAPSGVFHTESVVRWWRLRLNGLRS